MRFSPPRNPRCRALSLLELAVVIGILGVTAGLITYAISPNTTTFAGVGRGRTMAHIVTESTMKTMKEAILGAPGQPGYWPDMDKVNMAFPWTTGQLFLAPNTVISAAGSGAPMFYSTSSLWFTSLVGFNPKTGKGWRGPYLDVTGGTYPYTADATNRYFTGDLHPSGFGSIPVPMDGWGNPIVLQWGILTASQSSSLTSLQKDQVYANHARMISAGPNGILDSLRPTSKAVLLQYSDFLTDRTTGGSVRSGDDIVTFFFWPALP